jgi:rhamnogalacturonyl hydrolase YesR
MTQLFFRLFSLCLFSFILFHCKKQEDEKENQLDIEKIISIAEKHYSNAIKENTDLSKIPRSIEISGKTRYAGPDDWTSGFFPGCLWYLFENTGDEKWKEAAIRWTENLESQKYNKGTHDVGFMIYCSFGNGLRLTNEERYKSIIIEASNSLTSRFNKNIGLIKSWDWASKWQYPVIVDNMMNLEMLFFATKLTGDSTYFNIAKMHALNTMKNHYRKDYSSYHVVDFDNNTFAVREKVTHQGVFDSSSWARGQAWGLYGFTVVYRETKDPVFLKQAEKIAEFIMNNPSIPKDNIPYWDYNTPGIPDQPRDASAAAITASALLELQEYIPDKKKDYLSYATTILKNLSSDEYMAKPGTNSNFLLMHSTGNFPDKSEVNTAIIYADYYFLEAITRLRHLAVI